MTKGNYRFVYKNNRTCDFTEHALEKVLLLALLDLLCGDGVFAGQDGVAELDLLPKTQSRESSFQRHLHLKNKIEFKLIFKQICDST